MNPAVTEFNTKLAATILPPEEFLTTKELMKLLKIKHRQTIYDLIAQGLPAIPVGRNYRFIKSEVLFFLKSLSVIRRNYHAQKSNSKEDRTLRSV